jgi:hypothetical protein
LSAERFFGRKNLSDEQMVYILPAHRSPHNFPKLLLGAGGLWCWQTSVLRVDVGQTLVLGVDVGVAGGRWCYRRAVQVIYSFELF